MGLDMMLYKNKKNKKNNWKNLEELVYWRKANQIHRYFVENVQNGIDDCSYYKVSKEQIEELLRRCKDVINRSQIGYSKIIVGQTHVNGHWEPDYQKGRVISNPGVAETILPTQGGFFFGNTNYDEFYLRDIERTIEELEKVLEDFDFENDQLVYSSSW